MKCLPLFGKRAVRISIRVYLQRQRPVGHVESFERERESWLEIEQSEVTLGH
jgi:hypothetical protein